MVSLAGIPCGMSNDRQAIERVAATLDEGYPTERVQISRSPSRGTWTLILDTIARPGADTVVVEVSPEDLNVYGAAEVAQRAVGAATTERAERERIRALAWPADRRDRG